MGRFASLLRAAVALALASGIGCSGSDDTEDPVAPPTPPNVKSEAVTVVTPAADVQASHQVDLQLTVSSATALEAVGVAYRAFPRADFDARTPQIVSHVLGTSAHDLPAGQSTVAVTLRLPAVLPEGEYYLIPDLDPLNTIAESDESDQRGAQVIVQVLGARRDQPTLTLERAVLDAPAIELAPAQPGFPGPIGLTLLLRAEASAPVLDAQLTACLLTPVSDCGQLPLGIWNGAAEGHLPALVVPRLAPSAPTTAHLDLALDPSAVSALDELLGYAVDDCFLDRATCLADWSLQPSCVDSCFAGAPTDPGNADHAAMRRCMLKCVPFQVEATLDKPGATLYEPAGAPFGRTITAALQLLSPPPVTPQVPQPLRIVPLSPPVFRPVVSGVWTCDQPTVSFVAEGAACGEPVVWTLEENPGAIYTERGVGSLTFDGATAIYTPDPIFGHTCYPEGYDTSALLRATACGGTATQVITLLAGGGGDAVVSPNRIELVPGAPGTQEFRALVGCAVGAGQIAWDLATDPADAARLPDGPGALVSGSDPLVVAYAPPATIAPGAPVPVTVRATIAGTLCDSVGSATVSLAASGDLRFEHAFEKAFANDQFGAGVDLYAGAFLDGDGARASAHAIVPVRVFDWAFEVLRAVESASVDPRAGGSSSFLHQFDVFGATTSALDCACSPGGEGCGSCATTTLWSDSKCVPEGPPPLCAGTGFMTPCSRSSECAGELTCLDGRCTQKCDGPDDCPGFAQFCAGSLQPGPYKRVFFIGVVPVTVEGKLCAEYGFDLGIGLEPAAFDAVLGPFFEINGYASAAVGYTGMIAAGVRGDLVLLRDDFYGKTTAAVTAVPAGGDCSWPSGCIQGSLREGIENVLQGGSGEIFLFVDYPTLQWCDWSPCVGVAQETLTLASWGSLYEVANACDFCVSGLDCPAGTDCVNGTCADGFPGLLCASQSVYVEAH